VRLLRGEVGGGRWGVGDAGFVVVEVKDISASGRSAGSFCSGQFSHATAKHIHPYCSMLRIFAVYCLRTSCHS